ncbi:uncharacterized protein LOC115631919 isoform X2 [Scaptodrosophila lebanonensis]|uniref:Uncharacterized protein LOC115631919 isoform X2 n=1 Tax=Drosophila lebanonensis TaxID=7225 RepID=A0A6J2UBQ7_DROLE|nr:uncharacterized protein LOC115631919 isoform X2 [Scaptodrosophila lebanonensis]
MQGTSAEETTTCKAKKSCYNFVEMETKCGSYCFQKFEAILKDNIKLRSELQESDEKIRTKSKLIDLQNLVNSGLSQEVKTYQIKLGITSAEVTRDTTTYLKSHFDEMKAFLGTHNSNIEDPEMLKQWLNERSSLLNI